MSILFLLIPVALLGAVAIFRGTLKPATTTDERGITLQTVIITAVLALAAAGAGIVIFNVINDETKEISKAGGSQCGGINDLQSSATLAVTCTTTG